MNRSTAPLTGGTRSVGTRSLELTQLSQIDAALREARAFPTASELGLDGVRPRHDRRRHQGGNPAGGTPAGAGLPASAVLTGVRWEGPPHYPYVYGRFGVGAEPDAFEVDLHSDELGLLSSLLGLQHRWGA
jgi:hypothetical protein